MCVSLHKQSGTQTGYSCFHCCHVIGFVATDGEVAASPCLERACTKLRMCFIHVECHGATYPWQPLSRCSVVKMITNTKHRDFFCTHIWKVWLYSFCSFNITVPVMGWTLTVTNTLVCFASVTCWTAIKSLIPHFSLVTENEELVCLLASCDRGPPQCGKISSWCMPWRNTSLTTTHASSGGCSLSVEIQEKPRAFPKRISAVNCNIQIPVTTNKAVYTHTKVFTCKQTHANT